MSEHEDTKPQDPMLPEARAAFDQCRDNLAEALADAAHARKQLVILVADIGWLIGAADQAGIVAPAKIHDHLEAAVTYLGGVRT